MFNLKKHEKTAQSPYEKYHRDNPLGPKVEEEASIGEKKLPHRDGYEQTVTEDQMKPDHKWAENDKAQVLEKLLETTKSSKYVTHRSDASELAVPPINALVEKIRQKRVSEDFKTDKKAHWSHTFNEKKQQGALPKWNKNAPQHDKIVLNNDPDRFQGSKDSATDFHQDKIRPLIGNVTTADVDKTVRGIKTGKSSDYDTAIMAILRVAHDERRELTNVEAKTIVDLKKARTNKLMEKHAQTSQ